MSTILATPMPPAVARLPRDPRGYPYFFTIQNPQSGEHSFLGMHPAQVLRCARERLCGICGEPLGYWIHFVGGPLSCENRVFTDPAMHMECLEYAMAVCPFLARRSYRRIERRADRPATMDDPDGVPLEGTRLAIFRTRRYQLIARPNGHMLFRAAPAKEIIWRDEGVTDVG